MSHRSKQTSCFACVGAKRACDKALPSCSRCLDKDIDCTYPPPRRRKQRFPSAALDVTSVGVCAMPDNHLDIPQVQAVQDTSTIDPASTTGLAFVSSSSLPLAHSDHSTTTQASSFPENLSWFLSPSAWTIAYHYQPPSSPPPTCVFTNFIRGLQTWLVRFLREGHNPFIHRHLYPTTDMPQCMQDAYSAIAVAQTVTTESEHVVDSISSSHISNLLACQPTDGPLSLPLLSTKEHLARTQALLIHILLALSSTSIPRRTNAESLMEILPLWTRQLWESAALDAATSSLSPNVVCAPGDNNVDSHDSVPDLYRAFVLSESIRRTWLLSNIATGVYSSLKATWSTCSGDIYITARGDLWNAPSSARWEAIARYTDPLFIQSLRGQSLLARGVPAAHVDEFARHIFTVMWGLEKVESWVIRTGDSASAGYAA